MNELADNHPDLFDGDCMSGLCFVQDRPIMKPKRIQRRRAKGWKMPPNTIYVGRPTKWGNPFFVGHHFPTREEVVAAYRGWLDSSLPGQNLKYEDISELRGKNLACWCGLDTPCHADVLLEIANR